MVTLNNSGKNTLKVAETAKRCLNCPLCKACMLSRPTPRKATCED